MAQEEQLVFGEYSFMIRGNMLTKYLGGSTDWQHRVDDMVKLREAFDNADVDGNNQVGFFLFFCDFQEENAEIAPFFVNFNKK